MSIDRRKLFALGGAGAIGAAGGRLGPEFNLHGGLTIHVVKGHDGWLVATPDWEMINGPYFQPGMIPQVKMVPVTEFFEMLEKEWSA